MNEAIMWITTYPTLPTKRYGSKNYFWRLMYPKSVHSNWNHTLHFPIEAIELKYQLGELTEKLFEIR